MLMCKQTYNASDLIKNKMLEIGDGYRAKNSEMGKYGLPFARAGNIKGGFQFSGVDLLSTENIKKLVIKYPDQVMLSSHQKAQLAVSHWSKRKQNSSYTHHRYAIGEC